MRGFNFGMISRAYPDSVAARGKSSIVRHTPSARKNDRVRQVSWLPDQHARPAFPDGIQWHRREHSPVTVAGRSEEHTSELQSLMRISYAVFCLKQKNKN